jgi:formate hydrogenlyase subunit 3/multisubunit Na+/H+ antiporter MnhD subunit
MIGAAMIAGTSSFVPRWVASALFTLTAAFNSWCTAMLLCHSLHEPLVYWFGNWWPRGAVAIGECFVITPFVAMLALLVSVLMLAASILSWQLKPAGSHLEPLMMLFIAAMCGFAYSGDLFNLFVWFELMSATAFALCGLKTTEPAPLEGSFNFGITNTVGAFFIITGIALLYARTGALNMAQIGSSLGRHADALLLMSFLFMTAGYLVKGAIVPFHLWLADAHAVAPTPVCVLFSGVMVELGLYAVARIYWSMFQAPLAIHTPQVREIFVTLGVITAILGGIMCFAQHHLKRLLAYSTMCHAGLMLIGVGLFDASALGGFLLYVLGHGLLKGGLFACAGVVLHRLQFIGEPKLHGPNTTIPAARAGASVTGVDIAPNLLARAQQRAATENLNVDFREGDAEELTFGDEEFDVVMSMFGAMFAPRPERVAAELLRVCKPGGVIAMANWTAEGFVGKSFQLTAQLAPPPPGVPTPVLWGNEQVVRQRFGSGVSKLSLTRRNAVIHYPFPPKEVVEYFRQHFGRTKVTFAKLGEKGQAELASQLESLWTKHNRSANGETRIDAEYLEVQATRA